jgi:hypothetical protein
MDHAVQDSAHQLPRAAAGHDARDSAHPSY